MVAEPLSTIVVSHKRSNATLAILISIIMILMSSVYLFSLVDFNKELGMVCGDSKYTLYFNQLRIASKICLFGSFLTGFIAVLHAQHKTQKILIAQQ